MLNVKSLNLIILTDAILQFHHEVTTQKAAKQQIKDALKTFKVTCFYFY